MSGVGFLDTFFLSPSVYYLANWDVILIHEIMYSFAALFNLLL